jgi:hypothetical protein
VKKLTFLAAAFVAVIVFANVARADQRFVANLSAAQEVPTNNSVGTS